jgi:hypothetical protein
MEFRRKGRDRFGIIIRNKAAGGVQHKFEQERNSAFPPVLQHDRRVDNGEYEKAGRTAPIPARREKQYGKGNQKHTGYDEPRADMITDLLLFGKVQQKKRQRGNYEVENDIDRARIGENGTERNDNPSRHARETKHIKRLHTQVKTGIEMPRKVAKYEFEYCFILSHCRLLYAYIVRSL